MPVSACSDNPQPAERFAIKDATAANFHFKFTTHPPLSPTETPTHPVLIDFKVGDTLIFVVAMPPASRAIV